MASNNNFGFSWCSENPQNHPGSPAQDAKIEMDGAGHGVRTRDIQLGKLAGSAQKSPKTLGENATEDMSVTKSVTRNTETSVKEALLRALKEMPKGDLVALLAEAITPTARQD